MYESIVSGALWKLVAWAPPFFLRWFFKKEDLAARTRIDVRNRPHAVQINGGEISEVTVYVEIQNSGYFTIELDRVAVEVMLAGARLEYFDLTRVRLTPDRKHEATVRGPIPPGHLAHYKRNHQHGDNVTVIVRAEFNCEIHNFNVRTGYISQIGVRAFNL
jgi:hypothetical protein